IWPLSSTTLICGERVPLCSMMPELEAAARKLIQSHRQKLEPDYKLQEGKMMIEIKPAAATKGRAVETFMQEPPFAGRLPVFVGDDITDEDGFEAVNRLGGLSVWVSDAPASRATAAQFRLSGVDDVIAWLNQNS
ncbi:MAG: trehalose-phosphatase, partial [Rhodospirillales bacterium]